MHNDFDQRLYLHDHHGHGHHGHHGQHHGLPSSEQNRKGLSIALMITLGIMFLEFFGGLWTGSLALLSDAGHMLSDSSSLVLSLIAIWFASKPPSPSKTYGFYRFEILAALVNAITLFLIAGFIVWEAIERLSDPPVVASLTMIGIASIGLLANLLSAWALMRKADVHNNLNIRSAYLHIIGDALGSVGAIVAGLLMLAFQWYWADPIVSVLVAILILKGAWGVIKQTVNILMEGTPPTINQSEVLQALEEIEGVRDVHDLHIWTITSGLDSLSCHLLIDDDRDSQIVLQAAVKIVEQRFHIHHTTIQIEKSVIEHADLRV